MNMGVFWDNQNIFHRSGLGECGTGGVNILKILVFCSDRRIVAPTPQTLRRLATDQQVVVSHR